MSQYNLVPGMGKNMGNFRVFRQPAKIKGGGVSKGPHKNVVCRFHPRPQRMVKQNGRQIVRGSMSLTCRYSRNHSDER